MEVSFGKVKPFTPIEAENAQMHAIPDEVYRAVNSFLAARCRDHIITVTQLELIDEIQKLNTALDSDILVKNHWLDFEEAYRTKGWKVFFDRPGYNESYEASFKFSRAPK